MTSQYFFILTFLDRRVLATSVLVLICRTTRLSKLLHEAFCNDVVNK